MKQHEATEKRIGDYLFYIRPFHAFTAANISGELISAIAPALAGLAPLARQDGDTDLMNLDVSAFSGAMSGLSGDKVEGLLKKLLTKHKNISVENAEAVKDDDDDNIVKINGVTELDNDTANAIFCGSAQDMFILAVEVINVNFKGFFSKISSQFGLQKAITETKKTVRKSTDDLTHRSLAN
jgi:hypothetical protein